MDWYFLFKLKWDASDYPVPTYTKEDIKKQYRMDKNCSKRYYLNGTDFKRLLFLSLHFSYYPFQVHGTAFDISITCKKILLQSTTELLRVFLVNSIKLLIKRK